MRDSVKRSLFPIDTIIHFKKHQRLWYLDGNIEDGFFISPVVYMSDLTEDNVDPSHQILFVVHESVFKMWKKKEITLKAIKEEFGTYVGVSEIATTKRQLIAKTTASFLYDLSLIHYRFTDEFEKPISSNTINMFATILIHRHPDLLF